MAAPKRKTFICPLHECSERFDILKNYLSHIKNYHDESVPIECNFGTCEKILTTFKSFRSHVYDNHRAFSGTRSSFNIDVQANNSSQAFSENFNVEQMDTTDQNQHSDQMLTATAHSQAVSEGLDEDVEQMDTDSNFYPHGLEQGTNYWQADIMNELQDTNSEQSTHESANDKLSSLSKIALWVLKLREVHKIPVSTVTEILSDVQELYAFLLKSLINDIKDLSDITDVLTELRKAADRDIFQSLKTRHGQEKFIKDNFNFIEPSIVKLGKKHLPVGCGKRRVMKEVVDSFVHIPVTETLKSLKKLPKVSKSATDGTIADYVDGDVVKRNDILSNENSLSVILYYDEVELCNPIGSKKKKHKLGMFYYTFGNISPLKRSRLSNIHLLAIMQTRLLKKYSINDVLKPIVTDLLKLEEGIDVGYGVVKGTVLAICADNLAACALGGFKESAGFANRHCRHCMITREEMSVVLYERDCVLRSKENHMMHCHDLETAADQKSFLQLSKEYGVNFESCLLQLKHCDIVNGALVPDIMHDILEGMLLLELRALLGHLINEEQYLTHDVLNHVISHFELGFMEVRDRPSTIDASSLKEGKLGQSASQMWLLGRLLPVMIGHFVPDVDIFWKNYLLLLKIMDYLFSPITSQGNCQYLQILISEHHEKFMELYPEINFTPKMHSMIHMPRIMINYGPLVRLWTMRFEAKHQYFKKVAQRINNFKNISKSLAMRHQFLHLYNKFSIEPTLELGREIVAASGDVTIIPVLKHHPIKRYNYVILEGTKIAQNSCLLLCVGATFPSFLRVTDIIVSNGEAYFQGIVLHTSYFSEHYHCYVVSETHETALINKLDKRHPQPLQYRYLTQLGSRVLVAKHDIFTK